MENRKNDTVYIVRVQVGHNVWFSVTPVYLFDGDVVKLWNPETDICHIGVVIGDYQKMSREHAEIAAGAYAQRLPLMEVRGKYVYEEFGR